MPADLADNRRKKSAKISAISGRKRHNRIRKINELQKSCPQISQIIVENNQRKSALSAGEKEDITELEK